ncbi:YgiQ family radical SAM protein [Gynuella sunshinyii]|uniref:Fe-S oxidoreductase n=1 Tax=Gynuella sunshinyii YC6258 TaxID=1445510 RepID=A0A0C5VHZ5_9GAMM|nr:YgiQ family radical SAM protein [Gynuella sunshinyii]AJQ92993.1 Fe-S oxidoreductase [Gynuella sunshinyii YC6258]
MTEQPKAIYSYRKYWAECFGVAPFLPMTRAEMDQLGWDSCDIIVVTGDAYVDHPSFGMAVIGRVLEAQGFRVGILAQPDWTDKASFQALGKPNLFFGVTAGNMDSMINRYTADKRYRHDDAYTAGNVAGKRPDRAVTVYTQKCKEAYSDVPVVIGGIEASLRRLAHYDYWSDSLRRSVLLDSTADILLFGNAERALIEIAHRAAAGESVRDMTDIRGTAFLRKQMPQDWEEIDSTRLDVPGRLIKKPNPYAMADESDKAEVAESIQHNQGAEAITLIPDLKARKSDPRRSYIRLPAYEQVKKDMALYAHQDRIFHKETNPGNARALVQRHGRNDIWVNPPPIPLTTEELDWVFEMSYQRVPHPCYGDANIPAYEMIRFSVNIMRGCFGGCTFCSITEHEGRVIQSRSEQSILTEIENIRDKTPGFTGMISDLGGPTANMYRLNCKSKEVEENCRRLSCVYPTICSNLNTDHSYTTQLYRKARAISGVKKIAIASGLRYDLAVEDPDYVRELVTHHVGGYLKIAPEHSETGPLSKMMKPGMGTYDRFKAMFERFSREAGKEQYLIPYFISAHPGSTDEDMMNLALWLKQNKFRVDQVQNFYPSPMATASTMYITEMNPLKPVKSAGNEFVFSAKTKEQRRLHKAFLRYHDPENWPVLRQALKRMGKAHLIGRGKMHLVPPESGREKDRLRQQTKRTGYQHARTQHTGLPHNPKSRQGRH